jgi:hypothetical protein
MLILAKQANMCDSFGSNFVNLGRTVGTQPGTYLIQRASDVNTTHGYSDGEGGSDYKGTVNFPTTQGSLLCRFLVRNNGTDLDAIRSNLDQITVSSVSRSSSPGGEATPVTAETFANLGDNIAHATLELTARLMQANPPFNMSRPAAVYAHLAAAGLRNGTYEQPSGVNETAAYEKAQAEAFAFESGPGTVALNNDWTHILPIAMFGDNLAARTTAAVKVYLALSEDETVYASWKDDFSLSTGEAYIIRFSSRPPLEKYGFLSLTMYNSEGFLVENDLGKYSVGDRSNITFPNGELVYGGEESEGAFEVLIQTETPPANWTAKYVIYFQCQS